jgi:hypothetical protein
LLQGTHHLYKQPLEFQPERFMPNGEYDQFDDSVRAFMFLPFIQVRLCLPLSSIPCLTGYPAFALGKGTSGKNLTPVVPPLRALATAWASISPCLRRA